MNLEKNITDYWFIIEPYVHIKLTKKCAFLYNILDGANIETNKVEIIELLNEILKKENCGVILLTKDRFLIKNINEFIVKIREKYMGDIIEVSLSMSKPVQLIPFFNFSNNQEIYKNHNFPDSKNILSKLYEIGIHLNHNTDVPKLISFLQSIPQRFNFNILGEIEEVTHHNELLSFFNQYPLHKKIINSYKNVIALPTDFKNNFSYCMHINFPIDIQRWKKSLHKLHNQTLPIEYVFDVSSVEECMITEKIVMDFKIEKYRLNPFYTGDNIIFFEDNVFLTKEDILKSSISFKDLFLHQAINIYDFGKINIMPNGDAYANLNHPTLGNIYNDSIYEIVHKEVEEGKSWFRIRNQTPCNDCIYQWLCPSPSNYEIDLGRPNLCHVKKNN